MTRTSANIPFDLGEEMEAPIGFSANLSSASLSDLVQMQCLAGTRCVARVTSEEEVGYLYFREGRLVHAMSPSNFGEAAALEILGWSSGSFEICNAGWPDTESIQTTFQGLLLRAAQARDESGHHNLLRFPRTQSDSMVTPRPPRAATFPDFPELEHNSVPPASGRQLPPSAVSKVQAIARLDAQGNVLTIKGVGAEALADAVALATRLAQLVGESLALEQLVAIEGTSPTQRTLIVMEKNGSGAFGVRAPLDVDLAVVRERYGI